MSVYLDPFDKVSTINFVRKAKARTNGGTSAVKPDGTETEHPHAATLTSSSFAVVGPFYFWVKGTTGTGFIERYDVVNDAFEQWNFGSGQIEIANSCATDGEFLYVAGVNAAQNLTIIEKWTITGTYLTVFTYADQVGLAPTISANRNGFVLSLYDTASVPSAAFFDVGGSLLNKISFTPGMVTLEQNICATRDRFFIPYLEDGPTIDPMVVGVYDNAGVFQYKIDFGTQAPEYDFWPYIAVSETDFFFFTDVTFNSTNCVVVIYKRDVVRDTGGNITADSINVASRAQYNLLAADFWYQATVDAKTFTDY